MQYAGSYDHLRFGKDNPQLSGLWRAHAQTSLGIVRTGVVNVHGWAGKFLGGNTYVDPLVAALQEQHIGVLLAERRGTNVLGFFGSEMRGASMQTIEQEVADTRLAVEAARQYARLERTVLVGFSIGATIAATYAGEAGSGIDGVVLISPTSMPQWMSRIDDRHEAILPAAQREAAAGRPDHIVVQEHQGYGMPVAAGAYQSLSQADLTPHLTALHARNVPVLVVHGSEDTAMHVSYGQQDPSGAWRGGSDGLRGFMRESLPTAEVFEIAGAGHDFAGEHAALLAQKVGGFVGAVAVR